MAYETKVILQLLADHIALAKNTKQAYEIIRSAAEVEGLTLPDFDTKRAALLGEEEEK